MYPENQTAVHIVNSGHRIDFTVDTPADPDETYTQRFNRKIAGYSALNGTFTKWMPTAAAIATPAIAGGTLGALLSGTPMACASGVFLGAGAAMGLIDKASQSLKPINPAVASAVHTELNRYVGQANQKITVRSQEKTGLTQRIAAKTAELHRSDENAQVRAENNRRKQQAQNIYKDQFKALGTELQAILTGAAAASVFKKLITTPEQRNQAHSTAETMTDVAGKAHIIAALNEFIEKGSNSYQAQQALLQVVKTVDDKGGTLHSIFKHSLDQYPKEATYTPFKGALTSQLEKLNSNSCKAQADIAHYQSEVSRINKIFPSQVLANGNLQDFINCLPK